MRILSHLSPRWARRRGLTLIEILVVSAIFAIIALSLFVVFKAGLDSWRRTQAHLEIYQNARTALDMMTRELSAAYLNPLNTNIRFQGFDTGSQSGFPNVTPSGGDEVFFIGALNPTLTDPTAKFELCQVGYWLNSSTNQLMRYYYAQTGSTPNYDFTSGAAIPSPVANNITQLTLQFYDSAGVARTWWDSTSTTEPLMQNKKPVKVDITITVQEPGGTRTQDFTTGVCIPQ